MSDSLQPNSRSFQAPSMQEQRPASHSSYEQTGFQQPGGVPHHQEPGQEHLHGGQASDVHLQNLKDGFISTANALTAFYQRSCNTFNVAYEQGQQDAWEEVYLWFLSQSENNDFKNVSFNKFNAFMQTKLNRLPSPPKVVSMPTDSELMPPPTNRPPANQPLSTMSQEQPMPQMNGTDPLPLKMSEETGASLDQEMIGSQFAEAMDSYPVQDTCVPVVNKRVNATAFQSVKVPESKKRARPSQNPVMTVPTGSQGEGSLFGAKEQCQAQISQQQRSSK